MKKRIQVSLNPKLVTAAHRLMALRNFDSLSEFLESLIRDEDERRNSPGLNDQARPATLPASPVIPKPRRNPSRSGSLLA